VKSKETESAFVYVATVSENWATGRASGVRPTVKMRPLPSDSAPMSGSSATSSSPPGATARAPTPATPIA
jgi:hypothetical protein